MNLIIFGPPGSGKGTYAERLAPILKIKKISTGDIFREIAKQENEYGRKIKRIIEKGELVPDEIVFEIIKKEIEANENFILDGYPRTIEQAKFLEKISKIDAIINLVVPEKIIIARLSSRRICKNCGKIYNLLYLKPKIEGKCDECKGELYQRDDDRPETIRKRIKIYEEQSKPLLEFYKSKVPFINIECNSLNIPPEKIVAKILEKLKELKLID